MRYIHRQVLLEVVGQGIGEGVLCGIAAVQCLAGSEELPEVVSWDDDVDGLDSSSIGAIHFGLGPILIRGLL